jgi:hypothetical protein
MKIIYKEKESVRLDSVRAGECFVLNTVGSYYQSPDVCIKNGGKENGLIKVTRLDNGNILEFSEDRSVFVVNAKIIIQD